MKDFKAGKYIQQGFYKSFQPSLLHRAWQLDNMEIIHLLSQADRAIGQLDMYSNYIPNIDLFISMHVLKEATQSSKIEGTQTNMQEALMNKEDLPLDKRDDWEEVQNYILALNKAISDLEILPFSSRLIKETHKTLMQGVRGAEKQPGDFRTSQNWIGGASISDAVFVPPHFSSIPELMGDLEKFAHDDQHYFPELLKVALLHYQFETIHPFLDGNGRVGRLLIPLYLVSIGLLKKPVLYLSDFLEEKRRLYYDNLMRVREKNDLQQWFKFFLVGIQQTAQKGIETFDAILTLQKEIEAELPNLRGRLVNAQKVLNYLYQKPIVNAEKVSEITTLSLPSAYALVKELVELGVLKELAGEQRSKRYTFDKYLKLFA